MNVQQEISKARDMFLRDVAPEVAQAAQTLVENDRAVWVLDPYVEGVVALVWRNTDRALVVVYAHEDDWETSDEMDELAYNG